MRKSFASAAALALLAALPAQQADDAPNIDQRTAERLLARFAREHAPDRRTVVFDITVEVTADAVELRGEVHDAALERRLLAAFGEAARGTVRSELRVLPDPALGEQTFAVVCVSVANLRSKPGHAQELGTQALLGTPLRLLKRDGDWFYVQTPNDYLCWTRDRMQRMTPDEFGDWRRRAKVVVTSTFTHVRSEPDAHSRPISDAVAGGLLALEDKQGGFYRVRFADGRQGFVAEQDAAPFTTWLAQTDDAPDRLVATARRFFGVPYLWGGTSTKGMDCSGFTSTVWFLNGVVLPRDASQQVHAGVEVPLDEDFSEVRTGDLLFFGRPATAARRERITHVAISLGGKRFVHASSDVHENSFDPKDPDYSEYLHRSLLHVRRVVDRGPDELVRPLKTHPLYRPE